jgi:AcrR family transcriptional regulator
MEAKVMTNLTRKERERAARREAILDAAEQVFSERGYHRASMQEIAARAEFSVGHIYNQFSSKQGLYVALVDMRFTEHVERIERVLVSAEPGADYTRLAVAEVFRFFSEHEAFFRIFMRVGVEGGGGVAPGVPETCIHRWNAHVARMGDLVQRGVDDGRIFDADPRLLVRCMAYMTHAGLEHCMVHGVQADDAMIDTIVRIVTHGIAAREDV